MTERSDVDGVRVVGVDAYCADVARLGQADVGPCASAITRAVHAVTVTHVDANRGFAGARVDDVLIRRRDGERADRTARQLTVGDALPIRSGVLGLPNTTGAGAEVEDVAIDRVRSDGNHPATAGRADAAVRDLAEK